ncbi:hypothetical protein TNCV_3927551 [Trichonephila clavipes]|nr:hypothetical protein TNCV_3927551 [Trichonephila clavipes]
MTTFFFLSWLERIAILAPKNPSGELDEIAMKAPSQLVQKSLPPEKTLSISALVPEINRSVLKYRKDGQVGGYFSRKDRTYKRRMVGHLTIKQHDSYWRWAS